MKIMSVTVVDGVARVEVEGLETPVIVAEGQTLNMALTHLAGMATESLAFQWREDGSEKSVTIAREEKPA
jgi:broad specificity phosphatase PhoE